MPTIETGNTVEPYACMPGPKDENGCPVMRITSSARDDAARVAGLEARGRDGIDALELGVGRRQAFGARDFGFELGADREVLGRERERIDDGLQVQAGAPDEQRTLAP